MFRKLSMYSGENIEWVIKNSFTKKCENIPIYLNDNIYKSHWDRYLKHSLALYSKYNRPILKLSNFNNTELITVIDNKNECKVIAATFHERDLESKLMKTFNNFINYEIILAPNVLEQNSKSGAIVKFVTKK